MSDEENYEAYKKRFIEELAQGKKEILNEVRLSKAQIEEVVEDFLPRDHDRDHVEMRRFMDHSPEPKMHGDHHDFTEAVKANIKHMIISIFKGLGGILLIALVIGLYSWVKHQANL